MELRDTTIHGRRIAYRTAGDDGPLVVLIHGITQDSRTWLPLGDLLSRSARVIAVDLPGHGQSQNPPGDHSMGAYASSVRDLLFAVEEPRATLVGHSLGGGVAMQFSYLFPEMADRLVLIDSGGLGPEVSPLLRAACLPGADPVLAMLSSDAAKKAVASIARGLKRLGLRTGTDLDEVWRGIGKLSDPDARRAFIQTVRTNIGPSGQRVSARDRLYLAERIPTLLIWGARDRIIPLSHATDGHQQIPGSTLRVLRDAGHFPHLDDPESVAGYLSEFLASTEPAEVPRDEWGAMLRNGGTQATSA